MPYQYVREPITAEESDRLSNACETPHRAARRLDTARHRAPCRRICDLTSKNVLWQHSSGSKTRAASAAQPKGPATS